jgi:hypothetical protein
VPTKKSGGKQRHLVVDDAAHARLKRLANFYKHNLADLVDILATHWEQRKLGGMTPEEREQYFACDLSFEQARTITLRPKKLGGHDFDPDWPVTDAVA